MSVKKINISGNEYDIKDANAQAMISDEFDSGTSYTTGDYCIYENVLYKFTSDKSAGAWDSGKVAATNIDTELSSLNSSPDVINIILISGANYSGYGNCYYYKKGSRVHIHIGIQGLTEDTSTTIAVLPAGYRPSSVILAIGFGSSWTEKATLLVTQNGELNIQSEGTYAMADVEYDAFS